jgi:CRISPR-associated endonuclease/helicase Cas3
MFKRATGVAPFPYQVDLATTGTLPHLLSVPTGAGKTAAALLAWLFRRRLHPDPAVRTATPRRLVYCLPMRVLVEQTRDAALRWLDSLGTLGGKLATDEVGKVQSYSLSWEDPERICVSVLMGGESPESWDIFPERDAVLIGTQDMLLSRALNRGYGMSRYRWPLHFGLTNSDCLWVIDEPQLMGAGLRTTAQLDAFRRKLGSALPARTLWMSATLDADWLSTVDFFPDVHAPDRRGLLPDDRVQPTLSRRLQASKILSKASSPIGDVSALAREVLDAHQPDTRTLVILNTVNRASRLFEEVHKLLQKVPARPQVLILHSRFRPADRQAALEEVLSPPESAGTIVIATQVVEAGVDISSRLLITELAPWTSLVQRFGRCNRGGEYDEARVRWLDFPDDGQKLDQFSAPYSLDELVGARAILQGVSNARPCDLPAAERAGEPGSVLREKDLLDLFDTTPDLTGNDADISPFIRESDSLDVGVLWRQVPDKGPGPDEAPPSREEVCNVPLLDIRTLAKKKLAAWFFDSLEGSWQRLDRPDRVHPGMVLLLNSKEGRYTPEAGWNPRSKTVVQPVDLVPAPGERGYDADGLSEIGWQTLASHTDEVVACLVTLAPKLGLDEGLTNSLARAGRWHDAGKAHPVFQETMRRGVLAEVPEGILAKTAQKAVRHSRKHFRHELASGILALMHGEPDLIAYLAAAHHGKVRMTIRSLPGEAAPRETGRRFARGVWDGDSIPELDLGGGVVVPASALDLSLMDLGEGPRGPSWLARVLALREELGPFRLAFLEALVKAADERVSRGEPCLS